MIYTDNGLDLKFEETRRSLQIPVKGKKPYIYSQDPNIDRIGVAFKKIDYQQYLTRFKWNNLPEGLDSELFERVMYFCGSAMFFYIPELKKFFFLPYGMANNDKELGIDFYGRFNQIKPYSFNGATQEKKENSSADVFLSTQIRDNIKDIPLVKDEEEAKKIFEKGAVICWDTTPGLSYYVECRNRDSQAFIKYMLDVLIQTKSALINASGFNLFATETESASDIMQLQLDQINMDRQKGKLAGVISNMIGKIENLQSNAPAAMQDFWASLQSVDNLRLKSMGIRNDGVQQKSQYQNIQEQSIDIDDAMQVYWNAFMERVKFSAIVNSIWGLGIYPEPLLMPQESEQPQEGEEQSQEDNSQAQEGTQDA